LHKLTIGTAQFGMPYGIANQDGQVRGDEIINILDLAWENGIDTLDTAKAYGHSEETIGNYLKKRPENSWNIITKLSDSEKNISDQIQNSTKKLTILPAIVLAHSAELFMDANFQKELVEAKDRQIITKAGVSLYCEDEINRVMQSAIKPDVIQLPLNILDTRLYRWEIVTELHDKDIEIHVRSAFLQGLFYLSDSDLDNRFYDVVPYLEKLKSIAKENKLTLAELSLLWLVSLEEVSKVIIGVDNSDQLKMHLATVNKNVNLAVFKEALSIHYENENILNPSLW
jgi:aryl-alcohol dehydrogenase-like predicted oxidoreductase